MCAVSGGGESVGVGDLLEGWDPCVGWCGGAGEVDCGVVEAVAGEVFEFGGAGVEAGVVVDSAFEAECGGIASVGLV